MPWVSDEEYAQLHGGGNVGGQGYQPSAPGTANLSPSYRTALGRAQQQLGDQFQYDPQGNVWQPKTPFAASPAGANQLAGTLAAESGQPPTGSPPPAMWRPLGNGYFGRDAGTGGGTIGPPMRLGPDGQSDDWRQGVDPQRQAFLDRMHQQYQQAGIQAQFVPSWDQGGGSWRTSDPRATTEQLTQMSTAAQAPQANIQSQAPPTPAQAEVPSPKYNPFATGTPEQVNKYANQQSAPIWQQQQLRAQAAVPPAPNAVVQQRFATPQQQYFQAAPTTGTGQPVLTPQPQDLRAGRLSAVPGGAQPIPSAAAAPAATAGGTAAATGYYGSEPVPAVYRVTAGYIPSAPAVNPNGGYVTPATAAQEARRAAAPASDSVAQEARRKGASTGQQGMM